MTAWQRTHILRRDEKGFGPISFKRILIAGFAGVLVTLFAGRALGFGGGTCLGLAVIGGVLLMTHPIQGRLAFRHLSEVVVGLLIVAALRGEDNLGRRLADLLKVESQDGALQSDDLYETSQAEAEQRLSEAGFTWVGHKPGARPLKPVDAPSLPAPHPDPSLTHPA